MIAIYCVIGIAFVVFLLFFFDKKLSAKIKKLFSKKSKQSDAKKIDKKKDDDIDFDVRKIDYNTFGTPVLKEANDEDEIFDPNTFAKSSSRAADSPTESDMSFEDLFGKFADFQEEPEEEVLEKEEPFKNTISIGSNERVDDLSSFKFEEDDEYSDFLRTDNFNFDDSSISEKFQTLSPDLKALFLADVLKKKYNS